jgi:hypothetical protein
VNEDRGMRKLITREGRWMQVVRQDQVGAEGEIS